VVKLALVIVAVALGSTNCPLGFHQSSVSILKVKSSHKLSAFANARFKLLPATPLHITGILTLVLSATSHIFCAVVACANVGHTSLNKLSHLVQGSQSIKVQSVKSVAPVASTIAVSTCHRFGASLLCVAFGTIGLLVNVFTPAIVWFPVSFTTLLSIFFQFNFG